MAKVYDTATDLITFARLQSQNTTSGSSYLGSDGLLKFAAEDEPRIEYGSDGSLKGLLIEEQRTNLLPYSEDFSHSSWGFSGASHSSDQEVSPSGIQNASLIAQAATTSEHYMQQYLTTTPDTYTASYYVKAGTVAEFDIMAVSVGMSPATSTARFSVDTSSGEITAGSIQGGGIISSSHVAGVGNGWYRCSIVYTITSDTTSHRTRIYVGSAGTSVGDISKNMFIWGAQLEAGSFATSYIPTSGSQSTRSADVASIPVTAFGYNQDAGTVVVEASFNGFSPDGPTGYPRIWQLDQPAGDYLSLFSDQSGQVSYRDKEWGPQVAALNATAGDAFQAAVAFTDGDVSVSANGAAASTASPVSTLDMPSYLSLGGATVSFGNPLNGHIKSLSYFPRRLTDA